MKLLLPFLIGFCWLKVTAQTTTPYKELFEQIRQVAGTNPKLADSLADVAILQAKADNNVAELAMAKHCKANVMQIMQNFTIALKLHAEVIDLAYKVGDKRIINSTFHNLVRISLQLGQPKETLKHLVRYKQYCDQQENWTGNNLFTYHISSAAAHEKLGVFDKATYHIKIAELVADTAKKIAYPQLLPETKGNLYLAMHDYRSAQVLFHSLLAAAKENNSNNEVLVEMYNLGDLHASTKKLDSAKYYLALATSFAQSKNYELPTYLKKLRGVILCLEEQIDSARIVLIDAKQEYLDKGHIGKANTIDYWLSLIASKTGETTKASTLLKKAMSHSLDAGLNHQAASFLQGSAETDTAFMNYRQAYNKLAASNQIYDSMLTRSRIDKIAELEAHYNSKIRDLQLQSAKERMKIVNRRNFLLAIALVTAGSLSMCLAALGILLKKRNKRIEEQKSEILHNNKNSINQLIAVFERQSRQPGQELHAKENQERLYTLSLLNRMLYENSQNDTTSLADYLSALCAAKKTVTDDNLSLKLEVQALELDLRLLKDVGLIINEAIMNSMRHGLIGHNSPELSIVAQLGKYGILHLSIRDNGIGFNSEVIQGHYAGFGLSFIKDLVRSHAGTMDLLNKGGAELYITLKTTYT
ncbi:MAG: hypothetical protein RL660_2399 [Bacteroidota bacterium]|jgi:two-component sensor histidine kinase